MTERKKRSKKNKLEEIQKPRGYDRELELEEIVGATDCTGPLMFLVKWENCDEFDLLPATEVNEKSPDNVIAFYEDRCPLNRKIQLELLKPRMMPLPPPPKRAEAVVTEVAATEAAEPSAAEPSDIVEGMETDEMVHEETVSNEMGETEELNL